jgi:hypothetical protein
LLLKEDFLFGGSKANTSKTSPAIKLLFKTFATAFSLISPPLSVFIKKAVFFIKVNSVQEIILFVSLFKGQLSLIISLYLRSSFNLQKTRSLETFLGIVLVKNLKFISKA